jgi:AcrR family transcriptional regulator
MARPRVTEADSVLDAAARRLASHGIAGTTVDDVAAEAGVSRATVYRYIGGKNEIVQAVIGREAEEVLTRVATMISSSTTAETAIAKAVSTALVAIAGNPLLARLTSTDLRESLRFITIDSPLLVDRAVSTLSTAMRAAPELTVDERTVEQAVEESTRFVLLHLTTPRRDGSRLSPRDAGAQAAALIAPLLEPVENSE